MKNPKNSRKTVKKNVHLNGLIVKNPNSAGIDLGSKDHWVAVSPHLAKDRIKRFPTFTCNLHDISNWLNKCNVDSVAMESTGIYWIPLYEILENDGFDVNLCNAQHVKNLPGRQKTDAKDCVWIQKLHSFGLLTASFVPKLDILALRTLMRYRERLKNENSRHVLRMQKILTQMNVLLPNVLSDITGRTGTNIMKAIISGKTDPDYLMQFKNKQVKASDDNFLKALNGNYQDFYIKILSYELMHYEYFVEEIEKIDNEVSYLLTGMIKAANGDYDDSIILTDAEMLIALTGVDLTQVPGFEILSIRKLISETGIDMSKWKDAKHFTSWLRLSPNSRISGGKILSNNKRRKKPKAAIYFLMCAGTLQNSKTFLGGFLRRKKAQTNYTNALTATARKIAEIYYNMLKNKASYVELGGDYYEKQHYEKVTRNLRKSAERLGYTLVKTDK